MVYLVDFKILEFLPGGPNTPWVMPLNGDGAFAILQLMRKFISCQFKTVKYIKLQ